MSVQFEEYRDKILAIQVTARGLVSVAVPEDTAALDQCRIRMSRMLTAYHLFAERELFAPCVGVLDPEYRARVRQISRDCAALASDFRAFTRECMECRPIERWATYRAASLSMMDRIREHLTIAETEIVRCEQAKRYIRHSRAA